MSLRLPMHLQSRPSPEPGLRPVVMVSTLPTFYTLRRRPIGHLPHRQARSFVNRPWLCAPAFGWRSLGRVQELWAEAWTGMEVLEEEARAAAALAASRDKRLR